MRTFTVVVGPQDDEHVLEQGQQGKGPEDKGEGPHGVGWGGRVIEGAGKYVHGGGAQVPKDHPNRAVHHGSKDQTLDVCLRTFSSRA